MTRPAARHNQRLNRTILYFAVFCILVTSLALAVFLESAKAGEAPKNTMQILRTEISQVPWDPESLEDNSKVVYGDDDRIDLYETTDPVRRKLAAATCGLIDADDVTDNPDDTVTITASEYRIFGLPACLEEPFADQPTAAGCTGFLVGPDLVATAGHCYDGGDFETTVFIFGFVMESATTPALILPDANMYWGVEVVAREYTPTAQDYAIVRLDRPVTVPDAVPLIIRRTGTIPNGTQIGVIGHPSGLPLKLAFGQNTRVADNAPAGSPSTHFIANLDTYGGNSGSPIFNANTAVVEGILVRGEPDFVFPDGCFLSNQLDDTAAGEDSTKTTFFAQFIPELPPRAGTVEFDTTSYACDATATITLADYDLSGAVTATVEVTSENGDSESLSLQEDTLMFATLSATIPLAEGSPNPGNGTLEVADGQSVTVLYHDEDDGTGASVDVTDTAAIDCPSEGEGEGAPEGEGEGEGLPEGEGEGEGAPEGEGEGEGAPEGEGEGEGLPEGEGEGEGAPEGEGEGEGAPEGEGEGEGGGGCATAALDASPQQSVLGDGLLVALVSSLLFAAAGRRKRFD